MHLVWSREVPPSTEDAGQVPLFIPRKSPLFSWVMLLRYVDSDVNTMKTPFKWKCCHLGSGNMLSGWPRTDVMCITEHYENILLPTHACQTDTLRLRAKGRTSAPCMSLCNEDVIGRVPSADCNHYYFFLTSYILGY